MPPVPWNEGGGVKNYLAQKIFFARIFRGIRIVPSKITPVPESAPGAGIWCRKFFLAQKTFITQILWEIRIPPSKIYRVPWDDRNFDAKFFSWHAKFFFLIFFQGNRKAPSEMSPRCRGRGGGSKSKFSIFLVSRCG